MTNKIFKISDINFDNIYYDNLIVSNNKNFIVSKIWLKNINEMHTLNIQSSYMKVFKFIENSAILIPNEEIETFLEKLDKLTLKFINDNNLAKKYNLKKYKYKTLINEMENPSINVLRVRIYNDKKPPLFFSQRNKHVSFNYNDAQKLFSKVDNIKLIFEIDGLIIDMNKKIILTNMIIRHVLLHEIIPKKIELSTDYLFVDSDKENNCENKIDENDIVLNTQTEYMSEYEITQKEQFNKNIKSQSNEKENSDINLNENSNIDSDENLNANSSDVDSDDVDSDEFAFKFE
jgi:hypothetical protein